MTKKLVILSIISVLLASSCSISYKFNGASIDYSKVRSIAVVDFTNQATQTRLALLKRNGDLQLEGEITGYTLTPLSIGSDSYAAETRLTMTVRVRFTNNTNTEENFERTFSANRTFPSTSTLESVQDQLVTEMIDEIVDNVYNATVANW